MKILKLLQKVAIIAYGLITLIIQFKGGSKRPDLNPFDTTVVRNILPPKLFEPKNQTITLEFRLNPKLFKDSGQSKFARVQYITRTEWKSEWKKPVNGIVSWSINTIDPIYLNIIDLLAEPRYGVWLAEPGDQVLVTTQGERLVFYGKGSEKFALQYQLDSIEQNYPKPANPKDYRTKSIADYLEWNNYLETKMNLAIQLINTYKSSISDYSYNHLKDRYINKVAGDLNSKFGTLWAYMRSKNMSMQALCNIYDTAYSRLIQKWSQHLSDKGTVYLSQIPYRTYRNVSFESTKIPSREQMNIKYYIEALKIYTSFRRERFIIDYFPEQLMKEVGFTPEVEKMLDQYYAEKDYPEYKNWMKEQEVIIREQKITVEAPDFNLLDTKGSTYNKESIKGKFAILNFWVTGSPACKQMSAVLKKVQGEFNNDSNIVFLNISADKNIDQWLSSIKDGIYTMKSGIHLYAGGEGANNSMIRQYAVNYFPSIWVMHPDGRIIKTYPKLEPIKDSGKAVTELIQKYLAYPKDGPYVLDHENVATAWYINSKKLSKITLPQNKEFQLPVQTDINKTFPIAIKNFYPQEPSVYAKPSRVFALSDIEGNFDSFRKLLQANKIIDEHFNWTFGDGHLVFAGDMFDRGLQVTECLWLLYSLEEKAKSTGGYVHFILGNHEIMNLQGDYKYVQQKYKDNALLMGKTLEQLYNKNSELGKWLRSKNIMEKIGDLLFVHGGISPQVLRMPLTITEINNLSRPYYEKPIDSTNQFLVALFGNKRVGNEQSYTSPFWFRGYYGDIDNPSEIPSMKQLDSTLQKFNVNRIITGHTIIADTISVHYNGKVINTDTKHAKGKSEALLIEGNCFYRVNVEGVRKQLP